MCFHGNGHANNGVPLSDDLMAQLPADIQSAWEKFFEWRFAQPRNISRKTMPPEIKALYDKMLAEPIPGYEGLTGKDSCQLTQIEDLWTD